jgi:hypothetical protein
MVNKAAQANFFKGAVWRREASYYMSSWAAFEGRLLLFRCRIR